ncbi:MAG: hypothetical protein KDK34_24985, partial [Leptospiraceae bacterium]|nr:hypothetical protein [Leptospiraceae bacterium]
TPHLDSLAQDRSYWFTHFYSAGIHTYNGVYSTLFGFPASLPLGLHFWAFIYATLFLVEGRSI